MLLLASKSAKDDYCAGRVSLECSQSRPCTAHPTSPTAKRRPATNSAPPSSEKKAAPNASTISSMAKVRSRESSTYIVDHIGPDLGCERRKQLSSHCQAATVFGGGLIGAPNSGG